MLEEHENQETSLQDLIDLVERDDLPTNEFTIQDKDPMVILGKLNEVIANLQTISASERGTKVYRGTLLLNSLDIKPMENDIADNTTAITDLQTGKVDKVTGKQLSTEDFTTAEKNKLAGLNNYDDTQVQADITALQIGKANQSDLNTTNANVANKANTDASNITVASYQDKLKVGKLITDYTLSSESNSINITGLDLIAHGGVYEIECELKVNTGADVSVRVNNITETNYDILTINSYAGSNQAISVGGGINASNFQAGVIQPKGAILSFKLIQNSTSSAEYLYNNFSADTSDSYYRVGGGRVTTTSTVSSIQIMASQTILAGARIKIYAREK